MKGVQLRWWQPRHGSTGKDQWALDHVEVVLWVDLQSFTLLFVPFSFPFFPLYPHCWHYLQSSHVPPSLCGVSSLFAFLNQILNVVFPLTSPEISAVCVWFWISGLPSPVWSWLSQNFPFHIFLYMNSMGFMSLLDCALIPALICVRKLGSKGEFNNTEFNNTQPKLTICPLK